MPLVFPSAPQPSPINYGQVLAESIGYLALAYTGKRLPLQVLRSAAGYYIGTADAESPVSRDSARYYLSQEDAEQALKSGDWQQRFYP